METATDSTTQRRTKFRKEGKRGSLKNGITAKLCSRREEDRELNGPSNAAQIIDARQLDLSGQSS